jgi:UDP-glucose 4-epimerase
MKQKIFITGVAGFLGSHLADKFIKEGHQVVGCDNLIGGYFDNVNKYIDFYPIDCCNLKKMKDIMKGCDIVYHCAATPYEGLSVFSPTLITENIVLASVSTITAAIHNKVKRFVMCSSMARYGTNKVPFTEDMIPNPQDPYGIGKYCTELLLKNLAETHGMEWVVAVPHNIIGPRQKYDDPFRNVASIFINAMLQGIQPIIYGDGQQKRCFSYVSDCVDPLYQMAFSNKVVGQVINIGPDNEFITIKELAEKISNILKVELKPRYLPNRPQEVMLSNCSNKKARELLEYNPTYKLDDGLKEMVDYIREKGVKPFEYHLPIELLTNKTPKSWSEKLY